MDSWQDETGSVFMRGRYLPVVYIPVVDEIILWIRRRGKGERQQESNRRAGCDSGDRCLCSNAGMARYEPMTAEALMQATSMHRMTTGRDGHGASAGEVGLRRGTNAPTRR